MNAPKVESPVFALLTAENLKEAKKLFEKGVSVNTLQPGTNYTPYVVAAKQCNLKMLRYLDKKGADMDIETASGNPVGKSALLNAAISGCTDVVKYMIDEKKMDINSRSKVWQETALFKAADFNHVEMARFLIERGANVVVVNNQGKTAYDVANQKGHREIIALLEDYLRDLARRINTRKEGKDRGK